ncbi:MAG: response regulator transcription factor [Desulfohalobiaceae bacterium]|nr:response regulator transcription factor [Desulfohalobiaceae bacterium]
MIRILIVDDHAIVRKGLKQIVQGESDLQVTGEASSGGEVLGLLRKSEYDVLLLDIAMPGMNGLEILQSMKSGHPDLPVLMLSMHPEEHYAIRCIKAGAAGYLNKESAPDELIAAIRKVNRGGRYIGTELSEKMADALETGSESDPHQMLSDREFTVMLLIAQGAKLRDIAREHLLSEKTVSTYRSRILRKMGLKSNAELTRYTLKHGLID